MVLLSGADCDKALPRNSGFSCRSPLANAVELFQSAKEKVDSGEEEKSQRPRLDPTTIPESDLRNTLEWEFVLFLLFHVL